MSTNVTAQSVAILMGPGTQFNEAIVLADSSIQSALANSLGQDVIVQWQPYYNFTGGVQTSQESFILTFLVTAVVASNIISGIGALKTRLQAQIPGITNIVTWGVQMAFG